MNTVTAQGTPRPRSGTTSGRATGFLGLLALLALALLASLAIGSLDLEPGTVWSALVDFDGSREHLIVQQLRVPRTLIGLTAGAALGAAGAMMQALTRNALADPGILGISSGAALALLLALELGAISELEQGMPVAFVGALVAGIVVYVLGSVGRGGASPIKLAIAGATLAALLSAGSIIVLSLRPTSLDAMRFWLVGSIAGRPIEAFWSALPFVIAGTAVAVVLGRPLNALALGEEVGRSLGVNVGTVRVVGGAVAIILAGAAVAMAGPVAFVGLAVPHIARGIVGADYRWIMPYSIAIGATLVLVADILGRLIVRPAELQVGVVVALMGAPFFIYLVRRREQVSL